MKFFIGLLVVFVLFMSGRLPYTLIYDVDGASRLGIEEPLTASDIKCDIDKPEGYEIGDRIEGRFSIRLHNHSDRFLVSHIESEIVPPKGYGTISYEKVMLNPEEERSLSFRSGTRFVGDGYYQCEVRYYVGWSRLKHDDPHVKGKPKGTPVQEPQEKITDRVAPAPISEPRTGEEMAPDSVAEPSGVDRILAERRAEKQRQLEELLAARRRESEALGRKQEETDRERLDRMKGSVDSYVDRARTSPQ